MERIIDDLSFDANYYLRNDSFENMISTCYYNDLPLLFRYRDGDKKIYLEWEAHLSELLSNDNFIPGEKALAEDFIVLCLKNIDKTLIQKWLLDFYNDHINEVDMKLGILHVISHIDYDMLYSVGQSIAIMGLSDPDDEVIEFSIKAFENWEDPKSVELLRGRQIKKEWLQEYLDEVIKYLEEL